MVKCLSSEPQRPYEKPGLVAPVTPVQVVVGEQREEDP